VVAVVLGVVLARLTGVMGGMGRMAMGGMSVMRGLVGSVCLVVLGGLAVVLGGMLVMFGRGIVMLYDLFLGHGDLLGGCRRHSRRALLHGGDRWMSLPVDR
jgi:hypothetical protein